MKRVLISALLFLVVISQASAAIVTSLSNLQIGANYYNVTIHTTGSFNEIWDQDGDGIFGESDGSIINRAPMFWGDYAGAYAAALAVTAALGNEDAWGGAGPWDSTSTPYGFSLAGPEIGSFVDQGIYPDNDTQPYLLYYAYGDTDMASYGYAYVSYEEVAPVPIPAAIWLFSSGILGLISLNKRRTPSDH